MLLAYIIYTTLNVMSSIFIDFFLIFMKKIIFNERLKELRQLKSLKQSDMADLLKVTVVQYQRYEYGKSFPRFLELLAIADFFGVSLDYLVGRDEYVTKPSEMYNGS